MKDNKPNNPIPTVGINATYDANPLIDQTVTKIGSRMSDTVVSLWNLTFGWIENLDQKNSYKREKNLKKFKAQVEDELSEIPSECWQEPRTSIVGPAIRSTEFYFEENHYRDMFSKLISSSFDKRKNSTIHPSFATIIQELSKEDAQIFQVLSKTKPTQKVPILRTYLLFGKTENDIIIENKYVGALLLQTHIHNLPFDVISQSLYNLQRLGLIYLDWTISFGRDFYDFHTFESLKHDFKAKYDPWSIDTTKGTLEITTYGQNFAKICL